MRTAMALGNFKRCLNTPKRGLATKLNTAAIPKYIKTGLMENKNIKRRDTVAMVSKALRIPDAIGLDSMVMV